MSEVAKVDETEWRHRFEEAENSGHSLAQVATKHEVPITTARYWKKRLRGRDAGASPREGVDGHTPSGGAPTFARIESVKALIRSPEGGLLVELDGVRLRVAQRDDISLAVLFVRSMKETKR